MVASTVPHPVRFVMSHDPLVNFLQSNILIIVGVVPYKSINCRNQKVVRVFGGGDAVTLEGEALKEYREKGSVVPHRVPRAVPRVKVVHVDPRPVGLYGIIEALEQHGLVAAIQRHGAIEAEEAWEAVADVTDADTLAGAAVYTHLGNDVEELGSILMKRSRKDVGFVWIVNDIAAVGTTHHEQAFAFPKLFIARAVLAAAQRTFGS
mmetsp:Transcript_21872/g.39026  ORF Transcript_21872/g.39026 Transcript_21872/m.39026 type:complete len:207 (-) Transcript_21872:445-1065(-)